MDISKGKQELNDLCKDKDWFYDVGTDQYGRLVVYTKWQSEAILRFVPDKAGGVQVLVHYAQSKTVKPEDFASLPLTQKLPLPIETDFNQLMDLPTDINSDEVEEQSLRHLQDELDKLEKICGTNTLSEVFFEEHDADRAITNMSTRYPAVRESIHKLYQTYGFDLLYENLEL